MYYSLFKTNLSLIKLNYVVINSIKNHVLVKYYTVINIFPYRILHLKLLIKFLV